MYQTSFVQFPSRDNNFTSIAVTTYISNDGKVYTTHGVYSGNENNIKEIIDRAKKMAESAMEKIITDLISRTNKHADRESVEAKQLQQTNKAGGGKKPATKRQLETLARTAHRHNMGVDEYVQSRLGKRVEDLTGADAHALIQESISKTNRDNSQVY